MRPPNVGVRVLKLCRAVLIILLLFCLNSHANEGARCSSLFRSEDLESRFENGHNKSLVSVMTRMRDFEYSIQEFVEGLTPKTQSEYLKDESSKFRNNDALNEVLDIAHKYEKILSHLIEHSDHMMMSPRIQMIPVEKRQAFAEGYKMAYVKYLETFHRLTENLESMKDQDPSTWNNQIAKNLLMQLHAQMGEAHNKF